MITKTSKLLAAAVLLAGSQQAFAQHATAGTQIGNTANVEYKVSGVSQTTESGTANFIVDRLVALQVTTTDTSEVGVVPDTNHTADTSASKALRFQVANNTNAEIGVNLVAANAANATANPFGSGAGHEDDSFDAGTGGGHSIRMYLDDGDGVFEPGADDGAAITSIDSIAQEDSAYVWVVADIPAVTSGAPANGDVAILSLKATAREPNTLAAITYLTAAQANNANTVGTFDSVAFDDAGVASGDVANDGTHSAYSAYEIASAQIVVTKSSFVLSDPVNGIWNGTTRLPKAIPGAVVLYCIEVDNGGSVDATDVTINDNIPVGTTYYDNSGAGTIRIVAPSASSVTCNAAAAGAGTLQTDASDGDNGSYDGTKVSTTVSTLTAGDKTTTVFQVTVD